MTNPRVQPIIDEIAEHRERYVALYRSLTDEQLRRPVPNSTWIVKDFFSHLATIDVTVAQWFKGLAEGGQTSPATRGSEAGAFDIDHWNDAQVAKRRDTPLEEIIAEGERNREALVEQMRRFTDEHLDAVMHFGGDSKRPPADIKMEDYLRGWAKHDPIHVNDVLPALPEIASDPAIRAWVDHPVVQGYARAMAGPAKG